MTRFLVVSELGDRYFNREEDATDYQIKILLQAGVRSEVHKYSKCKSCENETATLNGGECKYCGEDK